MTYVNWEASMQTPEARAAVDAWVERKRAAGEPLGYHDPEMLMCLDKGDIVSRYQLLLQQSEAAAKSAREHHDYEMRQLKAVVEAAGKWWTHCQVMRRKGRKTAQLADMPNVVNERTAA